MMYLIFRQMFRIMFTLFFRWRTYGSDKIPSEGPVILISNHISNLDPPLVGSGVKRKVIFMAKEELFKIPVIGALIRSFGAFPIKRNTTDTQAIKQALKVLKGNNILGIFPEGTRSKTGKLGKGLSGAAIFALRTGAVVIPVAVIGPYRWFRELKVIYGDPMDLSEFQGLTVTAEVSKEATEKMMAEIQKLLDVHS